MSFLHKLGIGTSAVSPRSTANPVPASGKAHNGNGVVAAVGSPRGPQMPESSRISNGLKEFLWNLDGLGRGTMLDLGPAWQTTLSFFIERGFRVTSEDILRGWAEFSAAEEERTKNAKTVEEFAECTPDVRARRFLKDNLNYPSGSFDALLLWDLLDYLEPTLAKVVVGHLTDLLRPGAVVFAMLDRKSVV